MKKIVIFLCIFSILTCSVFAGGSSDKSAAVSVDKVAVNSTGFPIVNEPLTLTVFGIKDANQTNWEDMWVFKNYEEMTGIHMDFQEVPDQGREENKALLFASNELPDILYRPIFTADEITRYGVDSGQLMPLNDLIDQYAPNLKKLFDENPNYRRAITSADGNIYCLPQIDVSEPGQMGFKSWINKDWLEALGLEAPTTPEEFIEVLRAFKTQDPNGNGQADEIPFALREINAVYTTLGGSWGLHWNLQNTINVVDGKVHFWLKDDVFKDYLMFLNQLYEEGLLWSDFYKRDLPMWRSILSGAKVGIFFMPYSDVFQAVEDQYTALIPIKGPNGDQFITDAKTGVDVGAFSLSATCKNPEAAIRWVDYFYSEEGSLFLRYGREGETFYYDETGNPQFVDSIQNDERGFMTALGELNCVPGGLIPCIITDMTCGAVASNLTKEVAHTLIPYTDKAIFPPTFTPEETEEMVFINQDLNKYRDESVSRFIVGEYSFDMWDKYCDTLDKIGLERLEEIYQTAYDRSMAE